MAAARTSAALEIRKLRKKLRQIENLERIDRELTDDEYYKIDKKDKTRENLLRLLATQNEEESEGSITASTKSEISGQGQNTSSIATDDFSASYSEADLGNVEVTVIEHEDLNDFEQIDVEELEVEEQEDDVILKGSHTVRAESADTSLRSTEITNSPEPVPSSADSQTKAKSVSSTSDSPQKAKSSGSPTKKKAKKNEQSGKDCAKLKAVIHRWRQCRFGVVEMEGHSDLITDVCADGKLLVSASRDTTLKLWDLDTLTEVHSYGGHTGTVTSVVILNRDDSLKVCESVDVDVGERIVISGSLDCSYKVWCTGLDVIIPPSTVIRGGQALRSVYTYNPVTRVGFHSAAGAIVTGSDGGKVELWDAKSGENLESTRQFDSAITGLKVHGGLVYCCSEEGLVKMFDVKDGHLSCLFASENVKPAPGCNLTERPIRGMAVAMDTVYYGDEGTNIKVLNWKKGEVSKLMNHSEEFGMTDSLCYHGDTLLASSYNLDTGKGSINVRYLPEGNYMSTLDDQETERIIAITSTTLSSDRITIVTAGLQLKIWTVEPTNSEGGGDLFSSKFITRLAGVAVDSEPESDTDFSESEPEEAGGPRVRRMGSNLSKKPEEASSWMSWCALL
ncbi:uncharacterized protein LOC110462920 [Mizuhopecten yessoensis]|uniref:WD repeat-containing protein 5B n=1 Tax=Mizuhopecten yessoensis TaxID=6573 RepID=A0A210PX89_MIZYE|nr:uncharacterized protein LOC110462920 [Mizuhopecten yessoensis]OWF41107.1 WD repeat-containing protein 5B [Mizuhopecten yessoensis]